MSTLISPQYSALLETIQNKSTPKQKRKHFLFVRRKNGLSKDVDLGDKILTEQKYPWCIVAACYHYYLGSQTGEKLAKQRLKDILTVPELADYFMKNNLEYCEERARDSVPITFETVGFDSFWKYVAQQCACVSTVSPLSKLLFRTNYHMMVRHAKKYDEEMEWYRNMSEGICARASEYHCNWWRGDQQSRKKFLQVFLHPEVMKGFFDGEERVMKMRAEGANVCYSDSGAAYSHIMRSLSELSIEEKQELRKGLEALGIVC